MKRIVILAAACLWGCSAFRVPAPEIQDYRLDYEPPTVTGAPLPVVVRVAPFRVATVYAREAIVYRSGSYETGTFVYHRWATSPGNMVADLLARDLSNSGLYLAVQQGPSTVQSDYALIAEIEEIEERIGASDCSAHLRLRASLLGPRTVRTTPVMFQRVYEEDEPCGGSSPEDLVAAMSRALEQLSGRLQRDMYQAIASTAPKTTREEG